MTLDQSTVSLGLLHFPVYNKKKEVVVTSITTSSLHDISRTARTFGVEDFYIITPMYSNQQLAERLIRHWQVGYGAQYNPVRRDALQRVGVVNSLGECLHQLKEKYGQSPVSIATSAKMQKNNISYRQLRERIQQIPSPYIIFFGTGWGIEQGLIEQMDVCLEPVYGQGEYNHLSVRAAVAVILDRLVNSNAR